MLSRTGYQVGQDELGDDRPDLLAPFYAAAEAWLAGGGDGTGPRATVTRRPERAASVTSAQRSPSSPDAHASHLDAFSASS